MTIPVISSGTHTISTLDAIENLDASDTTNTSYVLVVDTANLANGETVTLRINTKVLSGDSFQLAYSATFQNVQSIKNKYSPPIPANIEIQATIEQNGGTKRAFKFAFLNIAG